MVELTLVAGGMLLLGISFVMLLIVWLYRYIQYRRSVQLSQARWLRYGVGEKNVSEDSSSGFNWPSLRPFMLSPIPEELHESGRDSTESDMSTPLRRHSRSHSTHGMPTIGPYASYGSFDRNGRDQKGFFTSKGSATVSN